MVVPGTHLFTGITKQCSAAPVDTRGKSYSKYSSFVRRSAMLPRRGRLWSRKGESKGLCTDSASVSLYGVSMLICKLAVL